MEIRKYQDKDKNNLRKICIETAPPQKNEKGEKLLTLLYNDYYTEQEKDNCFVLVDQDDNAVGYIICAQDFDSYKKVFVEKYLPKVRKLSFAKYLEKLISLNTYEKWLAKDYPSHLHIDILPGFTGKGSGSMLIETLFEHLKAKGVKGIMLGVGYKNKRAIKFYKKHGLKVLKTIFNIVVIMGKAL
ncbi:MAG: GNAT family N-acetyltransferase [Clostridiales bacterium]|nr:GNAT family N-acetyltransferase [Clostridiales bacterium]